MATYGLTLRYQNHDINQDHNSRDMHHHKRNDIDYTKSIAPYIHIKAKDFYRDFFKKPLAEYNKKQKRKDRIITDYYKAICNDKQKHPYNEILFKLGDRNDKINDPKQYEKDSLIFKKICYEYVDKFIKKYPNLKVIGAYYHPDEIKGADHIHINYVPIAYNQTRGLSVQVSQEKALNQMGFKTTKEHTAQMQWTAQVNKEFEEMVKEKFKIKEHGKSRGYTLSNTEYKKAKEQTNELLKQDKSLILRKETELAKLTKLQEQIDNKQLEIIAKQNPIIERQKQENEREFNRIHKNELQERNTIQTKNTELVKIYNSNLEQYKRLTTAIENKSEELQRIKNEIETKKPKLTELQEQQANKKIEENTKAIKEQYQEKLKQLENDSSPNYKQIANERLREIVFLREENNRLKSTIKTFFDLAKEQLGNVLNGILQVMKKFYKTEFDTLNETTQEEKEKGNGREI